MENAQHFNFYSAESVKMFNECLCLAVDNRARVRLKVVLSQCGCEGKGRDSTKKSEIERIMWGGNMFHFYRGVRGCTE